MKCVCCTTFIHCWLSCLTIFDSHPPHGIISFHTKITPQPLPNTWYVPNYDWSLSWDSGDGGLFAARKLKLHIEPLVPANVSLFFFFLICIMICFVIWPNNFIRVKRRIYKKGWKTRKGDDKTNIITEVIGRVLYLTYTMNPTWTLSIITVLVYFEDRK